MLSKELKEHGYYKKKGLVEKLASKFVGQIAMLDSGDVLQVSVHTTQPYGKHSEGHHAACRGMCIM